MASNIKFKRSAVQNRVPTTAQLDLGELALNTYDGKLYTEINTGSAAVVEIGSKLSSLVVDGDNGGGGGDVVFHGTTAARDLTWDYSDNSLKVNDEVKLKIGTSEDLLIWHGVDGSENSYITQQTGKHLIIKANSAMQIRSDSINLWNHSQSERYIACTVNSDVKLYFNNLERVTTTNDGADIGGTGSLKIPVGTTAQRSASPVAGDLRYNSTTSSFEGYSTDWGDIGAGGIGVGSDASNPRTGIIQNRVGVGFTDLNIVGAGISVTGYGTTVFVDFNEFKPGSFHRTIHNYTATAGQTTFAGLNYEVSEKQIAVYLNGARLSEATYTATSGTTVVLDVGASVGDEVEIINIHTNSDVDRKVNTYTATAGQTTFTGLSYNSKQELDVYLNGIRLASDDYTATSGSTVVLAVGASVNDTVDIVSTGDGVTFRSTTDASGDRFTLNNVGIGTDQTPDALDVRGNVNVVGVLTATTLHGDGQNLTNTGSSLSEPSSGTQRLVTTSLTSGTMTSSGTGSELTFDYANNLLKLTDNTKAVFGTGGDFELFHDGTYNRINSINHGLIYRAGFFHINNGANNESIFKATQDLGVELYYNNTKRFETTSTGASVTGNLAVSGVLTYDDVTNVDSVGIITARNGINCTTDGVGKGINIGAGQDLIIQHNGTNSFIDNNTGDLYIQTTGSGDDILIESADDFTVKVAGSETAIQATGDGAVQLYYDNSIKFATSNTGVSVTGAIASSGNLSISNVAPKIFLTDTDSNSDFAIRNMHGVFGIHDSTNSANRLTINSSGNATFSGNVTVSGNLSVTGTTTQNNTVATSTKVFTLASGAANDAAADGGGIAVDSGDGDKTWLWVDASNAWTSSEHIQVAAGKVFGFADDTNTFIDSPAADRIDFTLGNSEIFKFTTDTLELTTSSATPAVFVGDSNRTGAGEGIVHFKGDWNGTTVARMTIDTGSDTTNKDDGFLRFWTAPAGSLIERLRIASNGHIVTQGLTAPSFNNDSSNAKVYEFTGDGTVGEYGVINISGNSNTDQGNIGNLRFINRENSNSSSGGSSTSRALAAIQTYAVTSDSNAGDDSGGDLQILTKPESGNVTERLRIKSDGSTFIQTSNVNINRGTSGAGYPLTVRGPSSGDVIRLERANSGQWHFGFDGSTNFTVKSNTSEVVRITTNGDVGIGYNSPTVRLHVREAASGASSYDNRYHIIVEDDAEGYLGFYVPNSGYAGIRFADTTGTEGYIDYYFANDEMHYSSTLKHIFKTANVERFRINAAGNASFGNHVGNGPWSDNGGSTNGAEEVLDFGSGTANRGFGWGGTTGNYANVWTEYSSGDLNIASGLRPTQQSQGYVSSYGGSSIGRANMELRLGAGEILFRTAASSTVANGTAVSTLKQKMRITSGTAVEIGEGTGSDGCGLAIYGGTNNNVSGQDAVFYVRGDTNSDWGILLQKATEYGMRINTNSAATLAFAIYDQSNTQKFKIEGDGDVIAQGSIDSASDIKLKTNIKTIDNALDKVLQLRGAEYDRIDRDNQHEIGVIAQEVEKVIPELVHGDETKTVSYGNITAVLIEAIKEQNEIINRMRKEIDDLKN